MLAAVMGLRILIIEQVHFLSFKLINPIDRVTAAVPVLSRTGAVVVGEERWKEEVEEVEEGDTELSRLTASSDLDQYVS
ncbi:unnamed protein product [Boreogadus saida]